MSPYLDSPTAAAAQADIRQSGSSHGLESSTWSFVLPVRVRYAVAKRSLDIVVSSLVLILGFIPMLLLCILVKLTSKGPAVYRSERAGLGGKPFMFLKFRSMYVDADQRLDDVLHHNEKDGPIFKMENDPRTTPLGRIMRKYSLDELPQFLHVLKGEMTLVGPRPPLMREVALYDEMTAQRLSVKPGITCYWQISGRSDLSFEKWMELDRKYIKDMSFWLDLKILVKTPIAVVSGEGAY